METPPKTRELIILDQIEQNPDVKQTTLAEQLDVAVGTVNWHIKRFIEKGYVKVKRAKRRKLRYIITPEGLALRARLTVDYIENSMRLFRRTRERVLDALIVIHQAGYDRVQIVGDGDLAEVIRLTCIEQGFTIDDDPDLPALEIQGWKIKLNLEEA
jgi:DNA-binding MarR family transcriptional regulator